MAEKELRRMSREELVEIIYAMQQSQHRLEQQNEELRARLDERTLKWEQAGSLAEAALSLNHVFEDAQAAADQYLASLKAGETDARAKADELTAQAQRDADKLIGIYAGALNTLPGKLYAFGFIVAAAMLYLLARELSE